MSSLIVGVGTLAAALLVLTAARFVLGSKLAEPWVKHLDLAQTSITILAAVVAASWYFVERPMASRLKIEQSVTGIPVDGRKVLIVAEVTITNLSASALDLRKVDHLRFVQQVTPLVGDAQSEEGGIQPKGDLII